MYQSNFIWQIVQVLSYEGKMLFHLQHSTCISYCVVGALEEEVDKVSLPYVSNAALGNGWLKDANPSVNWKIETYVIPYQDNMVTIRTNGATKML
jgi:hypothetical protein